MNIRKTLSLLGGITFILAASRVEAATIDLTTVNAIGTDSGAVFVQASNLSGTGQFPSFVQIDGGLIESAYNTTVNGVLDNKSSDVFNHAIQVSELQTVTYQNTEYYGFLLDINEANNTADKYLSLDDIVLTTSTTANQSTGAPTGTVRYDLSAGTNLLLDGDLSTGSGRFDLVFLAPKANFAGALSTDYVYLYSSFGAYGTVGGRNYANSGGFEEWALGGAAGRTNPCLVIECTPTTTSTVPEPASMVLLGGGLLALGRRFRKNRA